MWSNYGMTFIEYMFLNKFRKDNKFVQISGGKLIDEIKKMENLSSLFLGTLLILKLCL